jgi:hypothetical protein
MTMAAKNRSKKASRKQRKLQQDRVGDFYADIPDEPGEAKLRVSFKRNWYSPPLNEEGEIDLERAQEELATELTGGTILLASYLENGRLGYRFDIPVASKEELEHLLRTIRKLYVDGLKYENEIRRSALDACRSILAETETSLHETGEPSVERRKEADRRTRQRRGRQLLGRLFFRKDDRRMEEDRRDGNDRRVA